MVGQSQRTPVDFKMIGVPPADRFDFFFQIRRRTVGTKPQVELCLGLTRHHVGGPCAALNVRDLESGGRKVLIPLIPAGRGEFTDDSAKPVNRVIGKVRIGNVPLDAPDLKRPAKRAPSTVFYDIPQALGAGGFANQAPVDHVSSCA